MLKNYYSKNINSTRTIAFLKKVLPFTGFLRSRWQIKTSIKFSDTSVSKSSLITLFCNYCHCQRPHQSYWSDMIHFAMVSDMFHCQNHSAKHTLLIACLECNHEYKTQSHLDFYFHLFSKVEKIHLLKTETLDKYHWALFQ